MDYFFECSITPLRKYILDMEDKIEELFSNYDEYNEKLKSQILMVTMELLENAEKYSQIGFSRDNFRRKAEGKHFHLDPLI